MTVFWLQVIKWCTLDLSEQSGTCEFSCPKHIRCYILPYALNKSPLSHLSDLQLSRMSVSKPTNIEYQSSTKEEKRHTQHYPEAHFARPFHHLSMAHLPPSPSLPRHHSVLRQQLDFKLDISHNVSVPPLSEPNMILISTVAVALNPCDWKMPARFPCAFATCGCDFVGKVVRIGAGVTRELKIGDRVFGAVHGSNPAQPESGTFAQYIAASADFVFVLPDNMPWEKAAALGGIGVSTIGVALFYSLKPPGTIERPATKRCYVLVSGGASASGTMAIQCLRLFVCLNWSSRDLLTSG
jgi:hypothetical protein